MSKISILFLCILLCACVSHPVPDISFSDRTALAFTGKGAAAGMMMDAYLGGAGVAIGIAIDEGIAKDIAQNMKRSFPDFDMTLIVANAIRQKHLPEQLEKVEVLTYGFRTVAGEGDLVSAWLIIKFISQNNEELIHYPQDVSSARTAMLSSVKTDAVVTKGMLEHAAADVVRLWKSKSTH